MQYELGVARRIQIALDEVSCEWGLLRNIVASCKGVALAPIDSGLLGTPIGDDCFGYVCCGKECVVKRVWENFDVIAKMILFFCMRHPLFVKPIVYDDVPVILYKYSELGDIFYTVMEKVDGRTLCDYKEGCPIDTRIHIIKSLAFGLSYLEDYGLTHGDVHTGNVMVSPDARLTIIDIDRIGLRLGTHVDLTPFLNIMIDLLMDFDDHCIPSLCMHLLESLDHIESRPQCMNDVLHALMIRGNLRIDHPSGTIVLQRSNGNINYICFERLTHNTGFVDQ